MASAPSPTFTESSARVLARPVVSVGNLSLGGRGKTPIVALLARWLVEAGEQPAILTRGYRRRRREDGVVVVSDGRHLLADVDRSGDEPLMLARAVPAAIVLVSELRVVSGTLAERVFGATVHVLDDGFQHRRLARDLDIVIVAASDLSDRRVPFGRLREPVSALRRADAILIDTPSSDGARDADLDTAAWPPTIPRFKMRRKLGPVVMLSTGAPPIAVGARVVTVAGIANPDRFGTAVAAAGWGVAERMTFGDHHRFTRRDVGAMAAALVRTGASAVLTTEKDAVRLLPLRPLPMPVGVVGLEVAIDPDAEFRTWMFGRLREARA